MQKQRTALELVEGVVETLQTREPSSSDQVELYPFNVLEMMRRQNFPSKFLRIDWKTPDFIKRYDAPVKRDDFRDFRGLFLTGPTGRKKTASICLLARDWLDRMGARGSKAWEFVSFPELCVEFQEAWQNGGSGPMRIINRLAKVPILILDDVGAEKTTDFVIQSAYLLFNKREMSEMPTYGTSNLTIDQIREKLDDRIASRIQGMCHVVGVGGEDQRVK